MKIGIMTFWGETNYGQNLQAYATYKWLTDMGHDVFLIRNCSFQMPKRNIIKNSIILFLPKMFVRFYYSMRYKQDNSPHPLFPYTMDVYGMDVYGFLQNHTKLSSYYSTFDSLASAPPLADLYVAGSDQIWNLYCFGSKKMEDMIKTFFLDFGSAKTKRISFAASWGNYLPDDAYIQKAASLLKKFNYVSVREKDGVEKCGLCGRNDAEWVPDPTLLLPPDKYRELYDTSCKKPSGKYVFAYVSSIGIVRSIVDYAASRGFGIIIISTNSHYILLENNKTIFTTIPRWLYLIDNAECVITDSFHGTIFSMQFGKNFANIGRENDPRFISLYEMFGIPRRAIKPDDFSVLDTPPDYTTINARLKAVREKYNAAWFNGVAATACGDVAPQRP